jgi:hypothetical protein
MTGGGKLRIGSLKFFFLSESQIPPFDCMVGFAFRRPPSAVMRNRVRRILREAFRMQRAGMLARCAEASITMRCVVLFDFTRTAELPTLDEARSAFREFSEKAFSLAAPTA